MKTKLITLSLLMAAATISCNDAAKTETSDNDTVTVTTPTEPAAEPAPKPDSAAMAKAWMEYMTPGDMHKWMASTDGVWTGEVKSWMAPDAPPVTNPATQTSKMVMGGRYQQSTFKSTMEGQPFEGMSTLAYDNAKKLFVTTWIDNMGTGITQLSGTMDEATKTINLTGTMTDPATGKDTKTRQVCKYPDANTQSMEMYCEQDGKEMKVMELTLTKK